MKRSTKHILILVAVLAVTGFVYAKLSTAYFCAYDDFLEVHRAAFEDTENPRRVITTTHFESYKYRPLNRGLNLVTYWFRSGEASNFRTRNVLCHLLNVVLIYALAWILFRCMLVGGTAALLFGLHPLANHAVVGAVMTNSAAHSMLLIAIVTFVLAVRNATWLRYLWLGLALLCGWLSLLTYEAAVVAYPLMFAYLFIQLLATRRWPVSKAFTVVLTLGCLAFSAAYYLLHIKYVPYSAKKAVPQIAVMLKSTAMYVGALLLPIDPVMANSWFGTPLPSDIEVSLGNSWLQVVMVFGLIVTAVLAWLIVKYRRDRLVSHDWPAQLFVAVCGIGVIAPLIVFTDKPSETYLYLTVAFAVLLFASILVQLLGSSASKRGRIIFASIVVFLSVSYGTATWVRNHRVALCGETAKQIVTSLHQDRFKSGFWYLWLTPARGEPGSHRYGMYGWRGVDTIGYTAVESAAQLVNGNKSIAARVIAPKELETGCRNSRDACFVVHADGKVDEIIRR